MKLLYQNFDGLDVSFCGAMPPSILDTLKKAKEKAQQSHRAELVMLGSRQYPVMVAETGSRGGYAYIFDTGPDGETWFVAHSGDAGRWNIRASVKSLNLALNGYAKVRQHLTDFLDDLGAYGLESVEDGVISRKPLARISRFDYCFDLLLEDFVPNLLYFVSHPSFVRGSNGVLEMGIEARARNVETLRVGKMPGRQITIYNKTKEILVKNKFYWWDIWGIKKEGLVGKIWRVEVRAGKRELKNWNLCSYEDLERMAGDIVKQTLKDIRYTKPTCDTNASRWPAHPIWKLCMDAAEAALEDYSSNAERKKVMQGLRLDALERLKKNFPALMASYTSLLGLDISELPETMERVSEEVIGFANENVEAITKKFLRAEERYLFLK